MILILATEAGSGMTSKSSRIHASDSSPFFSPSPRDDSHSRHDLPDQRTTRTTQDAMALSRETTTSTSSVA